MRTRAVLALVMLSHLAVGRGAFAQGVLQHLLLQGIVDAEAWSTDSGSTLLTRASGHPGLAERLTMWSAYEPLRGLDLYVEGEILGGPASAEGTREVYLDQAGVRFTASRHAVFDAGKLSSVVGAFAGRRFSTRNPLIGVPDGYPLQYPVGVQLSGEGGNADYRVAVVSLPMSHPDYLPDPSATPRPAASAGYTLATGFRVGMSGTIGPYLNDHLGPSLPAGADWRSYQERIIAGDVELSRGHFELYGEIASSWYDVPTKGGVSGLTYYVEPKYTLTPRLFVAARLERNKYPFVLPIGAAQWIDPVTNFYDGEIGLGYRVTATTLLKSSVRADRWDITPNLRGILANGHAFALQLSQAFDVTDWMAR